MIRRPRWLRAVLARRRPDTRAVDDVKPDPPAGLAAALAASEAFLAQVDGEYASEGDDLLARIRYGESLTDIVGQEAGVLELLAVATAASDPRSAATALFGGAP